MWFARATFWRQSLNLHMFRPQSDHHLAFGCVLRTWHCRSCTYWWSCSSLPCVVSQDQFPGHTAHNILTFICSLSNMADKTWQNYTCLRYFSTSDRCTEFAYLLAHASSEPWVEISRHQCLEVWVFICVHVIKILRFIKFSTASSGSSSGLRSFMQVPCQTFDATQNCRPGLRP